MLHILNTLRGFISVAATASPTHNTPAISHPVVTDLTIRALPPPDGLDPSVWHRIEKDLYLNTSSKSAWLYVAIANEEELAAEDLVITDIRVGEQPPESDLSRSWESRPGGIWITRNKFSGRIDEAVTELEVLFGMDAVDPRPQWTLMQRPLQIGARSSVPVARLSVLHGRAKPISDAHMPLRVGKNGKFKIVQISDTHMVTGVGVCKDAIDAHGKHLPKSEADPLTVSFMGKILDVEQPDLVILAGDQLHHDIYDTQSALFKVVAPMIERSIPFAAVFGNHDSEGVHVLSREAQMSILQNLPFSLCEPGPEQIDGIGNYYLSVLSPHPSDRPLSTLYFLDSHGEVPNKIFNKDYEPIKQSQIDWFVTSSSEQRKARESHDDNDHAHLSLVFFHIPFPEFGDRNLSIRSGHRREPTEGPSINSHFYDVLAEEGVSAVGCGHDHVNDFCALLPREAQQNGDASRKYGPWLCYGGGSGFGGYGSYGTQRYHRRMRVWELDTHMGSLSTWKRVEYSTDRVDKFVLVDNGKLVDTHGREDEGSRPMTSYGGSAILALLSVVLASWMFLFRL